MWRRKTVRLSSLVEGVVWDHSIRLAEQGVTEIDTLSPLACSGVTILDLSGNFLKLLKGIDQFAQLQQLHLQRNLLKDCNQLLSLAKIPNLKKVFLAGNPFLEDPLECQVLELLLQLETDIEVFSGELLDTIREVEHGEIKVIFLENYLNKISLHEQLRNMRNFQSGDIQYTPQQISDILSKIIPQYYHLIDDPKMMFKIKKEAANLKRQRKASFEDAIEEVKNRREGQINVLIKDIVKLLEENDSFEVNKSYVLEVDLQQNTISFSPERLERPMVNESLRLSFESSVAKEEITLMNTKQFQMVGKKEKSEVGMTEVKAREDMDALQTSRKPERQLMEIFRKVTKNKISPGNSRKQSRRSPIDFINSSPIEDIDKSDALEVDMKKHQNVSSKMYIRVEEGSENVLSFKPRGISPRKMDCSSILRLNNSNIAGQHFQSMYMNSLTRVNPMFSLLLSPLKSLSKNEATELLQALAADHKQKSMELMKEKNSKEALRLEFQEHVRSEGQIIQELSAMKTRMSQQVQVKQQDMKWANEQIKSYQQEIRKFNAKNKELEDQLRIKCEHYNLLEASAKKIKDICSKQVEEEKKREKIQELEEQCRSKKNMRIQLKYLNKMKDQAKKWCKIINFIQLKQIKTSIRRYKLCFLGLQQQRQISMKMKEMSCLREQRLLRQYFDELEDCREVRRRQIAAIRFLMGRNSLRLIKGLRVNEALRKERRLKQIWADRKYSSKCGQKMFQIFRKQRANTIQSFQQAEKSCHRKLQIYLFHSLKNSLSLTNQSQEKIEALLTSRRASHGKILFLKNIKREHRLRLLKATKVTAARNQRFFFQFVQKCIAHKKNALQVTKGSYKIISSFRKLAASTFLSRIKKARKGRHKLRVIFERFGVKARKQFVELKWKEFSIFRQRKSGFQRNLLRNLQINEKTKAIERCKSKHLQARQAMTVRLQRTQFLRGLQIRSLKMKFLYALRQIDQLGFGMVESEQQKQEITLAFEERRHQLHQQIDFLKSQIKSQSQRQMLLLNEKEQILLSLDETYAIMGSMKGEMENETDRSRKLELRYNKLVDLYNESVSLLQRKGQDFEWLHETMKDRQVEGRKPSSYPHVSI